MDLVQHLERLYVYDEWANREVLATLREGVRTGTADPRALKLLNHVVAAELLWLARLEKRAQPCPVWPDFTLEQCAARVNDLPRLWQDWFGDLAAEDLATTVSYVNSKGEPYTSSVGDVLTHVVLHSAYHRGQLAAAARASGRDPAYTDYIHATRMGLLE